MKKFLNPLKNFMGTDKVFVRYSEKEYRWWDRGRPLKIEGLEDHYPGEYPYAAERINNLAHTLRSGDIILSTKKPFYYAGEPLRGEHGSLHREDSHVPLVFIHKNLKGTRISHNVRIIDIAPTIAASMGFFKELREVGDYKDKLSAILTALEKHLNSTFYQEGLEATLHKIERFSEENKVKRDWEVDEFDMRTNFEIKVKVYLQDRKISQNDYDELVARYTRIIKVSDQSKPFDPELSRTS